MPARRFMAGFHPSLERAIATLPPVVYSTKSRVSAADEPLGGRVHVQAVGEDRKHARYDERARAYDEVAEAQGEEARGIRQHAAETPEDVVRPQGLPDVVPLLRERGPKSLEMCALLHKHVAPNLQLRSFDVPDTVATHVRFVALENQCTGFGGYAGEQDNDPLNDTDCKAASDRDLGNDITDQAILALCPDLAELRALIRTKQQVDQRLDAAGQVNRANCIGEVDGLKGGGGAFARRPGARRSRGRLRTAASVRPPPPWGRSTTTGEDWEPSG